MSISFDNSKFHTEKKELNARTIYTKQEFSLTLEEDDAAQVKEIFKFYDAGNRQKLQIEYLPKILRLLNYNVGNHELQDLILEVDRKALGFFTVGDMVRLLSTYKFKTDKNKELLEAFREIDHDADGFVSRTEMSKYLTSMGEPLEDFELKYLLDLATDPQNESTNVDIVRLSEILVPSDDIEEDLRQQANASIKKSEQDKKSAGTAQTSRKNSN